MDRNRRIRLIIALVCLLMGIGVVVYCSSFRATHSAETNVFILNTLPSGVENFGVYR